MKFHTILPAVLLATVLTAQADVIRSGAFEADLNPEFPGLRSYTYQGQTVKHPSGDPVLTVNGQETRPQSTFTKTGDSSAAYRLTVVDLGVAMTVEARISLNALHWTITGITETGDTMVKKLALPGLTLLVGQGGDGAALGNFPRSGYASEKPEDWDIIGPVSKLNEETRGASYAFVSNGKIAAGLFTNVLDEKNRMLATADGKSLKVVPGTWTWREIPRETVETPRATLVVATDSNGDGQVTWQDAAIAYRANTPLPYGAAKTRHYPVTHIAMNFGSQATNPFLRVLDNAKKVWLYTDGLGQRIQFKGYQSEGHDSSHPDYAGNVGRRQGGRDALNFVMRRGHDFNILSGVHINAQEYHLESKEFRPDIVDMNKLGWAWLDESYLTDYRYDAAYGTLNRRLKDMRADLPWLDFAYLDVYYGKGWPGWNMHTQTNGLGILQFTEFPGVMERAVVWNHVGNDWTQAIWGKGDRSEIARFIYYSLKDTFKHDPLLRGTNCDGFMGWHAERDMLQTVKSAITVNLPTKYLQHFALIRQEKDKAWFDGGVRTEVSGDVAKIFGRDGQLINSCSYPKEKSRPENNLVFIPWNPLEESKIYHWNDKGGESTWTLPGSWAGSKTALLYRLTDLGRVFEREIPVSGGKVTLKEIQANTPYVLYREQPAMLPSMKWGEGGLIADPGFDSHGFTAWTRQGTGITTANNDFGQTELVFNSPKAGAITQVVEGMEPGQVYSASVWVNIEEQRTATLAVSPYVPTLKPGIDKESWKVTASTKSARGQGPEKMLDGSTETLWHTDHSKEAPKPPHSVTVDFGQDLILEGFVQTARPNRHNGTIKNFEVAVSKDGKSWKKVASGDFQYDEADRATVKFAKPVTARYLKMTALSEWKGGPWASCAEFDVLGKPAAAASPAKPEFKELRRSIDRTVLTNFTDQSSKYMSRWHRMKILFTAPKSGKAVLALRVAAGDFPVRFDDVRLVKSGISTPPKTTGKVVLFEDFENVDEGWGPFMYGWKGPMNTHLSEANPPYTKDTIGGKYSLKSRKENSPDMLYRTVPAPLALKPNTTYRVSLDYLCDNADYFTLVAGTDEEDAKPKVLATFKDGSWTVKKLSATFTTDDRPDWFIGVSKVARDKKGTVVIDNILVEEI